MEELCTQYYIHPRWIGCCVQGPEGASAYSEPDCYDHYQSPHRGIARAEYEYEIPVEEAESILSTICPDETLEKREHAGTIWYVDVYCGILERVVIAEVELKQEGQKIVLPPWIGKEVTGDPFYKKLNMAAGRRVTSGREPS